MASPSIIGTSVTYTDGAVNPTNYNVTYTQGSGGQNMGLFLIHGSNTNNFPSGITWNGSAMTKMTTFTAVQAMGSTIWFLANPTTGSQTLTVTESGNITGRTIIVFSLQDVVQSSPTDVTGQSNVASAATDSKSITTVSSGDLLVSWSGVLGDKTASIAGGGGQTAIVAGGVYMSAANLTMFASYIAQASAGALSTSNSWTGNAGEDYFVTSLKYVAPTGGASTVVSTLPFMGAG